jgi:hypothetical protein
LSQVPSGVAATTVTLPADAASPHRMALAGDVLALAERRRLTVLDLARARVARTVDLAWDVEDVALSPSGRFVAAGPRQPRSEIVLHDLDRDVTSSIGKVADRWLTGVGFARHDGAELLLVARNQQTFTIFEVDDELAELAVVDGYEFEFDSFTALPVGRVASVGHFSGETRDSLIVVPVAEAVADPEGAAATAVRTELDFAYRLIAGPAEPDALVAFRDPEDAEEPDDEDGDDGDDDRPDVHGFRGLYVRDLETGELRERIEWDGPVARGDRCFATESWIAIAMRRRVDLVPRREPGGDVALPADAVALDPAGRRIAVAAGRGRLELLEFES